MNTTKSYDPGVDTTKSDHDLKENEIDQNSTNNNPQDDYIVTERFNSSLRYSPSESVHNQYLDDDEDW